MKTVDFLNIKINPITKNEFVKTIRESIDAGNQIVQNGINATSVNEAVKSKELLDAINNSDLVNIDGISVVLGGRMLGLTIPERVPCPDLAEEVLIMAQDRGYSVFLLGGDQTCIVKAVKNLNAKYPGLNIAGYRNGYFVKEDEKQIAEAINKSDADILLLGMPSPKKEFFVTEYKTKLAVKYFLGVGGYFDILAGLNKRAPRWVQKLGMEWFYRFMQEPGRLWRRYFVGNIKFVILVLKYKFRRNKNL